jgi:hypothetical protein
MFTMNHLGSSLRLSRSLVSTNMIENPHGGM